MIRDNHAQVLRNEKEIQDQLKLNCEQLQQSIQRTQLATQNIKRQKFKEYVKANAIVVGCVCGGVALIIILLVSLFG